MAKNLAAVLSLSFLLAGCGGGDPGSSQEIDELRAENEKLEAKVADLKAKGRASSIFMDSALKDFFEADEFWENTYDVGFSNCSNTCTDTAKARRENCEDQSPTSQCMRDATDAANACIRQCFDSHGPDGL
ncbi:MAG: hypothetical protein AAGJ73_04345 [Pseudomonadota bacterium]